MKIPPPKIISGERLNLAALVLLPLVVLTFIFRADLVVVRYMDPDELEHLHAAFSVFNGQIPGRDFFQHHTPLYYYLLAPIFFLGASPAIIFIARAVSQVFTALILWVVFRLAVRAFDRTVAWIAVTWLSFNFIFLWRTMEIRPDVPALLLFLVALHLIHSGWRGGRSGFWFWGGVFLGLAFLFTQKIIFPAAGVFAAGGLWVLFGPGKPVDRRRRYCLCLGGTLLPLLALTLYFAGEGALPEFWQTNFLAIIHWKRRVGPWHLRTLLFFNPFYCFWGVAGILIVVKRAVSSEGFKSGSFLLLFTTVVTVAGSWIINVSLPQYYLLFLPLLAIYAAAGLARFVWALLPARPAVRLAGWVVILVSGLAPPIWLSYFLLFRFDLSLGGLETGLIMTAALLLAALALLLVRKFRIRRIAIALIGLAILSRPANALRLYRRHDNLAWLGALGVVTELTEPQDRVLDGWSGLGVFRPHAYYYYFLHRGVLLYLGEAEKGEMMLEALRENPPALIIEGPFLDYLGPEVREYIQTNYRPYKGFLVRKENSESPGDVSPTTLVP